MPAGRKPPIMPPRNMLAEGRIAGKPPLPFRLALEKHRERQHLAKGMKVIAAIGGAPPPPRRIDVMAAKNAAHPVRDRALERAGRIIRAAQDRAAREAVAAVDAGQRPPPGNAVRPEPPRSVKPPKPEPGRYNGLKDYQPR